MLTGATIAAEPEGRVRIFVDASSSFDTWTRDPTIEQQQFMRDNYHRMLTYSPYFDSRLSWFPNAWEYKNAYAIYQSSSLVAAEPDWILRDASGNLLYIPYGCSGGSCPQFAADIGNPSYQDYFVNRLGEIVDAGYLGVFLDDVNLSEIMVGDGNGDQVTPIDPRTGSVMTLADWRRYFAEFTEKIRSALPEHEIVHNVHWWADRADPYVARQLEAADWINLERGISDSGIRGGSGRYGFESMLELIDWLHARGKHVVMEDDDDSGLQERDYELAFYLLINDGSGDVLASDGDRSRITPDQFWSGYWTNLGIAEAGHYLWNGLFRRDFECGIVLVNQPDTETVSVTLPDSYLDLSANSVRDVTLAPSSGQVLRQSSCQNASRPAAPTNLQVD